MSSAKRKLQLLIAFTTLLTLALAVGCRGFFVNQPSSLTVSPSSPSLTSGQTQAFSALAAFSGNTTKNVTTSATWTSSNNCIVGVIGSGTNAGNAVDVGTGGAVTITASFNGVSGTATPTAPTGLTISPCPEQAVGTLVEVIFHVGGNQAFTATSSGTNVTSSATWTSSDSSKVNFASASSSAATFPAAGTATITATTSTATGTLLVTVQ